MGAEKSVCQRHDGKNGTKKIHMFQFGDDDLDIEYKCETCKCDKEKVPQAPECSKNGTLICGGCQCDSGFKGNLGASIFLPSCNLVIYLKYFAYSYIVA